MGLSVALNTALAGLRYVESGIDVVAQNVANADTPGYTRKRLTPINELLGSEISTIRPGAIQRDVNTFVQQQLRTEYAISSQFDLRAEFMSRLDTMFGRPGDANALDTIVNAFGTMLQELSTSPEQFGTRDQVIAQAQTLAAHLNSLSNDIQALRREAEAGIADSVQQANLALEEIARLNGQIAAQFSDASGTSAIEDERDRAIDKLSEYFDIRVLDGELGQVRVFTTSGNLLVGSQAATLSFDERANLDPTALYSTNDAERGVGTVKINLLAGGEIDLFASNSLNSGRIAAYRDLRDNVLVEAQTQLDNFAHGLALAMSTRTDTGQAVTAGTLEGFDIDVADLAAGNEIQLTLTQTPPGTQQTFTFIRVDDAATLPLDDTVTADPNDTVIGIDFSGGLAGAAAAMDAALDAALGVDVTVSSPAADTIRILDDDTGGEIDIDSVIAKVTPSGLADEGLQLALFTEADGTLYTNNLDGIDQRLGFAARIAVNAQVVADNTILVAYSTSPPTGLGDPARPLELLDRFTSQQMTFHPDSGLGTTQSPLTTTVADFVQRVVSYQGAQADAAFSENDAQSVVVEALLDRHEQDTGVVVDEEMGRLLQLQNAYAANARVMSTVSDLIDILRQI